MIFTPTPLAGLLLVELEPHGDERGHFARTWCRQEFAAQGLDTELAQASLSFNRLEGTVRGLHFQQPPDDEVKLVRCTSGAIWDVAVDLRPGSPTEGKWFGTELTARNGAALYIPKGFAHGFQTLAPESEVFYQISAFHAPGSAGGLRYDDPALAVFWPLPVSSLSAKDASWPAYRRQAPAPEQAAN